MPNNNITKRYYPRLSEVVTVQDLPAFLNFIETGLNAIFDKIHYKNLQHTESANGDSSFYSIDIVTKHRLSVALPGGIAIVLNPDLTGGDTHISSFPVTLEYQWEILAYLRSFNLKGFSYSLDEIYQVGLNVFRITDDQVLAHTLNFFVEPVNETTTKYQQLINDVNSLYNASITLPAGEINVATLQQLIREANLPKSVSLLLFSIYILDVNDLSRTKKRLEDFYKIIVPGGIESFIKKIIIPTAKASFTLSAGIEFPRKLLQPIYNELGVNPFDTNDKADVKRALQVIPTTDQEDNPKVFLNFGEASFYVDTQKGFGYNVDLTLTTNSYAQIGNTGLIFFFDSIKLDLSTTKNIPEADADGRASDFTGVYINSATIGLPAKWFKQKGTTLGIFGEKLLIGTGGISGTIGLKAIGTGTADAELEFDLGSKLKMGFSKFDLVFEKGKITASDIAGSITVNLHDTPTKIGVKMHFEEDGDFSITASNKAGVNLPFGQAFSFTMRELEVGKEDSKLYLSTTGDLIFPETSPVYKILELKDPIPINKLKIWEDGHIEVDGGSIHLPKAITANLGPAKISITAIHMGSYEKGGRKYKYFGFDGGVNVNPGGVDVRGTGLKFYYTVDGGAFDSFISIDSIAIDLIIPGSATKETASVLIQGWLSVQGDEYMGGVALQLPKLNMAGEGYYFDDKIAA